MEHDIEIAAFIDGVAYPVVHCFTTSRVILDYGGLFLLADQAEDGTWDLSAVPSTAEEESVLRRFRDPMADVEVEFVE